MQKNRNVAVAVAALIFVLPQHGFAQDRPSIYEAVLGEPGPTQEISTAELRNVLANSAATVLDARPYMEYATSHIPGP
jgi:hypothetical protein